MPIDRTQPAVPIRPVPFFAGKAAGRVVASPLPADKSKERARKLTDQAAPAAR